MSEFYDFIGSFYDVASKGFELLMYGKEIVNWRVLGIKTNDDQVPVCLKRIDTKTGKQYVLHLPEGLCFDDISSKKKKIENALKQRIRIELADNYNVIITECNNKYDEIYKLDLTSVDRNSMLFDIGKDINDKRIKLDLGGNELHTGVFGSNGSGKSVFLNVLMVQFILRGLQIRVIDLKGGVEFSMYRSYSNLASLAITEEDAVNTLESPVKLMDKRYNTLLEKGYKSYKDCKSMAPVILLIDEYNALIENKAAKKALFSLLSRARAANIICIVSTQRPSHEVLPGTLKCNIKNFVTFRVENQVDSEIVLSQKGNYAAFTDLKNVGEGLLKTCGKITEFKGYYLKDSEILDAIKDKLTKHSLIYPIDKQYKSTREDIDRIDELI